MVVGIGCDIVEIARIRDSLQQYSARFSQRILADSELARFAALSTTRQPAWLAKRFAAKEATAKAFATGFRNGLSLRHIALDQGAAGEPILHFSDRAAELAASLGVTQAFVSLADEREYAIAYVILQR
ncbi:MAG: holo-ACP synthase [Gammaproteobacteria bacterium]|nr:holo-ACP synthase [Gammaproteobacteria bacterium]